MLKTILFDIDNTLLDFKKCAEEAIKSSFKDWNIEYKDEYFDVFMKVNNEFWDRYEADEITRDYLYKNRWKEVFKQLKIDVPGDKFEEDFIRYLYDSHIKVDNVEEVIDYLSDKYELYIVSNSSYDEQHNRLSRAHLDKYFKYLFTSEEIGHSKPNKEFFDYVFDSLDPTVSKDEILIIGDSPNADIRGGRENGIKTCWFDHNKTDENIKADYIIKDLLELKEIL